MKTNPHRIITAGFIGLMLSFAFLAGCSSLPQPTAAQNSAINATAAQLQTQLPSNALPYLQAAEVIYSAYTGQVIPASSIDTGNAKVNAVLQKATAAAPVADGDVSTLQNLVAAFGG